MAKGPKLTWTFNKFVKAATKLHKGKYTYRFNGDKNALIPIRTRVEVVCAEHGAFSQKVSVHLQGYACQHCGYRQSAERTYGRRRLTTKEFIAKSKELHGNIFTYRKTEYVSSAKPVTLTCKQHGDFVLSQAGQHVAVGCLRTCPHCARARGQEKLHNRKAGDRFKRYSYTLPDGREVSLQGYEKHAVELLLKERKDRKLVFGRQIPSIAYKYDGKMRTYLPDMQYGKTLVEVKSTWTWLDARSKNVRKMRAVMKAGFRARLLVFHQSGELLVDRETKADGSLVREYFADRKLRS